MTDFLSTHIAALLADVGLSALVGTRLWMEHAPAEPTMPFIVLNEIQTSNEHAFTGAIVATKPLIQYSIYASSFSSAKAVADALKTALIAGDDPVVIADERGMGEMTSGMHRRDVDAEISHVGS